MPVVAAAGQDKVAAQTDPSTRAAATRVSNDTVKLTPSTEFDGRKLTFDFPGPEIGVAEYEEGPTGCTVFYFPNQALVAADISRGAQCTIYSDYLENGRNDTLDAICLAGGSIYGLEAATGVMVELLAKDGYRRTIRKTTGAIIYDLGRNNMIYPDKQLGRAIEPFHTPGDGDVVYAATTQEIEGKDLDREDLGIVASELVWDAVLSCF